MVLLFAPTKQPICAFDDNGSVCKHPIEVVLEVSMLRWIQNLEQTHAALHLLHQEFGQEKNMHALTQSSDPQRQMNDKKQTKMNYPSVTLTMIFW